MPIRQFKEFLMGFAVFALMDLFWFSFVVKTFHLSQLAVVGRIENGQFDLMILPAIFVYVLMSLSFTVFVLPKLAPLKNSMQVFAISAFMGFIIYGVFDFTNLAILKNYPVPFAVVDILWGSFTYGAMGLFFKKLKLAH